MLEYQNWFLWRLEGHRKAPLGDHDPAAHPARQQSSAMQKSIAFGLEQAARNCRLFFRRYSQAAADASQRRHGSVMNEMAAD
jgi:hypothetical protein